MNSTLVDNALGALLTNHAQLRTLALCFFLFFSAQASPGSFVGLGVVYLLAFRPSLGKTLILALDQDFERLLKSLKGQGRAYLYLGLQALALLLVGVLAYSLFYYPGVWYALVCKVWSLVKSLWFAVVNFFKGLTPATNVPEGPSASQVVPPEAASKIKAVTHKTVPQVPKVPKTLPQVPKVPTTVPDHQKDLWHVLG